MSTQKQPCKECPFLKDSGPGWLGPGTGQPQAFIDTIEYHVLPCHSIQANYNANGKAKETIAHPCIGAMQFCANSCKFPRGAREPGHYKQLFDKFSHPNVRVFKWTGEFIAHHTIHLPKKIK